MYVYFTHCVGGHYLHVRSREAKTVTEKDRGSKRWVPTSHSTGPRESVCGPERSCVHILYSLSREMFGHNSGARNVIHLFASWRRVLQNIDERQSVGEKKRMHVWARPRGGGGRVEASDEWVWESHFKDDGDRERERQMGAPEMGSKRLERGRDGASYSQKYGSHT